MLFWHIVKTIQIKELFSHYKATPSTDSTVLCMFKKILQLSKLIRQTHFHIVVLLYSFWTIQMFMSSLHWLKRISLRGVWLWTKWLVISEARETGVEMINDFVSSVDRNHHSLLRVELCLPDLLQNFPPSIMTSEWIYERFHIEGESTEETIWNFTIMRTCPELQIQLFPT